MPPGLVLYIFVPREVGTRAALVRMMDSPILAVRALAHISHEMLKPGHKINKLPWRSEEREPQGQVPQ